MSAGEFPVQKIHTTQYNFSKEKFNGKFCFKEKKLRNKLSWRVGIKIGENKYRDENYMYLNNSYVFTKLISIQQLLKVH